MSLPPVDAENYNILLVQLLKWWVDITIVES